MPGRGYFRQLPREARFCVVQEGDLVIVGLLECCPGSLVLVVAILTSGSTHPMVSHKTRALPELRGGFVILKQVSAHLPALVFVVYQDVLMSLIVSLRSCGSFYKSTFSLSQAQGSFQYSQLLYKASASIRMNYPDPMTQAGGQRLGMSRSMVPFRQRASGAATRRDMSSATRQTIALRTSIVSSQGS